MTDVQLPDTIGTVGSVGTDPELRFGKSGKAYVSFRLGVSRPLTPGDWNGEKVTDWYTVVAFGSLAKNAASAFQQGDRVVVTGRYEREDWGQPGVERITHKIIADGLGADLRFSKEGD